MKLRFCLIPLLFGLFGCSGRVLDLDQEPPASPDESHSDPSLPASLHSVTGVWVEGGRLFWVAGGSFQSCLEADCKHTTITYATKVWDTATVAGGNVYWHQRSDSTLLSCPADGCGDSPIPVVVDHSIGDASPLPAIDADQEYFYWSSSVDIYRCPVSGCGAIPEVVASNAQASILRVDKSQAYWLDWGGLRSAPVDGSETPKLLVASTEQQQQALAVSAGYLYWTVGGSQLFRCPTTGCGASPPTLLVTAEYTGDGITPIDEIRISDNTMYWRGANAIHSCQLPDCEEPQLVTPPAVPYSSGWSAASFAVDANDVYWIGARDLYDTRTATIHRTPK